MAGVPAAVVSAAVVPAAVVPAGVPAAGSRRWGLPITIIDIVTKNRKIFSNFERTGCPGGWGPAVRGKYSKFRQISTTYHR